MLASLARHRRLFGDFLRRDLRARYMGSSMGFFWSVVFPFVNLFVYMFVFRLVLRVRWGDKMSAGETALIMLVGIMVWHAFAEAVSRMTNSLVENANLIQKVVFPSEIVPPYLTVSSLVNMAIGMPVAFLGLAWFVWIDPPMVETASLVQHVQQEVAPRPLGTGLPLVVLPLLVALQFVFTVGIGYFLAAFNLFLRDTFHLIGVLLTVWMFATPIFYPAEMVSMHGYGWILTLNPMHWLIEAWRDVILYGDWPRWDLLLRFAVVAVLVLAAGSTFFMRQKPRFPDLL